MLKKQPDCKAGLLFLVGGEVASQSPSGQLRGQLPTSWGAFCAGKAREKASSLCGEVTSAAKSEGLSPYTITALLKNLPYFFKKSLYGLDFRRLFCYNS